ncbi:MAG: RNA 2',3'-cyclic phosphodiesterase [Anaerolineae bacterium]|nr:RNA 2',3'-cyclic phosphodiesterase [Anaerolineae bacterium]
MSTIRTFIAIELPQETLNSIARAQARIKQDTPEGLVRWVQPQGIHLTLKFLGDTPTNQVAAIGEALQAACAPHGPFTLSVGGLGCFPDLKRPRVVWIGVDEPGGHLKRLQQSIERMVAPLGFPTEGRPFSPHLTLGRVKEGRADELRALGEYVARARVQASEVRATSVSLIRSDLLPGGAVYTPLIHAGLGGGAA